MYRFTTLKTVAAIAAIAVCHPPALSFADVDIEPGLDVWKTNPCDGAVDLPALPRGFFGPGSLEVEPCPDFELEGYPFPDICGPPDPFPKNEYRLQITWRDQHGNTVSADSVHRVTQTVRRVIPSPPYNFDTIVSRGTKGGAVPDPPLSFQAVDDEQLGNITFCWLSLKGCEKKEVRFQDGSTKMFEVFICLSDTPQVSGRMKFIAKEVRDGGGGGIVDLGDSTDPAAAEFEAGNFDFFERDQNALGLPLFYKVVFIDCDDPNNRFEIDDPDGTKTGFKTTVLWNHDPPEGSEEGDGDWEVREQGRVCVPEGLDCWATPPGGASVELPTLGPGFFGFLVGNPSNPIPGRTLEFVGWPFDIPCGRPRPENLPEDKLETVVVWRDRHGSIVGPDSIHRVESSTEVRLKHDEPRPYDTVVKRGAACFDAAGESQDVSLEILELSLRSVDPINVSFQSGPDRSFHVFVCLSDRFENAQENFLRVRGRPFVGRRGMEGRMRMTATKVDEAGGEFELDISGENPQQFDQFFENLLQDPLSFDLDFGFLEDPDALGLPVAYQLLFFELDPETGELIDADPETPEITDPANHVDSPFGQLGVFTTSLFHNQQGGTLKIFQWQPGDMNCDGVVDRFDIQPFILAREDPAAYQEQFGVEAGVLRDCNGDGVADDADVACFIQTILGELTIEDFWQGRNPDAFGDCISATYAQNFDGFADGTTVLGDGTQMNGTASVQGDALRLTTDGVAGGFASFIIPALPNSSLGWSASYDLTISDGPGANEPADGLSFNYGNFGLGELGSAEEGMGAVAGVTENLSFEIDTWMNLDGEQGVNIAQKVGGADQNLAFTNGSILSDGTTVNGQVKMSWDPVNGASFSTTGLLTNANFTNVPTTFAASDALLFGLSGRVGGANETKLIDNLVITTAPQCAPAPIGERDLELLAELLLPIDFRVLKVSMEDGRITICWSSIPGRTYRVEFSEDLRSWQRIAGGIVALSDITEGTFALPVATGRGFVRPVLLP